MYVNVSANFKTSLMHSIQPALCFFKDFRYVFVALESGQASVYRVSEQRPRFSVQYSKEPQEGTSIEPPRTVVLLGGRTLSVGARSSPIRIWNSDGELLQEIHPDSARGMPPSISRLG